MAKSASSSADDKRTLEQHTSFRSPRLTDVRWSTTVYDRRFVDDFSDSRPQIVRAEPILSNGAVAGHLPRNGEILQQSSTDGISEFYMVICRVITQSRIVAKTETGISVSLALNSTQLFAVRHPGKARKSKKRKKYKTLMKILKKYREDLPIIIDQKSESNSSNRSKSISEANGYYVDHSPLILTTFRLHQYLVAHRIRNDELVKEVSYHEVDDFFSHYTLRKATEVEGDKTGMGWRLLNDKFCQAIAPDEKVEAPLNVIRLRDENVTNHPVHNNIHGDERQIAMETAVTPASLASGPQLEVNQLSGTEKSGVDARPALDKSSSGAVISTEVNGIHHSDSLELNNLDIESDAAINDATLTASSSASANQNSQSVTANRITDSDEPAPTKTETVQKSVSISKSSDVQNLSRVSGEASEIVGNAEVNSRGQLPTNVADPLVVSSDDEVHDGLSRASTTSVNLSVQDNLADERPQAMALSASTHTMSSSNANDHGRLPRYQAYTAVGEHEFRREAIRQRTHSRRNPMTRSTDDLVASGRKSPPLSSFRDDARGRRSASSNRQSGVSAARDGTRSLNASREAINSNNQFAADDRPTNNDHRNWGLDTSLDWMINDNKYFDGSARPVTNFTNASSSSHSVTGRRLSGVMLVDEQHLLTDVGDDQMVQNRQLHQQQGWHFGGTDGPTFSALPISSSVYQSSHSSGRTPSLSPTSQAVSFQLPPPGGLELRRYSAYDQEDAASFNSSEFTGPLNNMYSARQSTRTGHVTTIRIGEDGFDVIDEYQHTPNNHIHSPPSSVFSSVLGFTRPATDPGIGFGSPVQQHRQIRPSPSAVVRVGSSPTARRAMPSASIPSTPASRPLQRHQPNAARLHNQHLTSNYDAALAGNGMGERIFEPININIGQSESLIFKPTMSYQGAVADSILLSPTNAASPSNRRSTSGGQAVNEVGKPISFNINFGVSNSEPKSTLANRSVRSHSIKDRLEPVSSSHAAMSVPQVNVNRSFSAKPRHSVNFVDERHSMHDNGMTSESESRNILRKSSAGDYNVSNRTKQMSGYQTDDGDYRQPARMATHDGRYQEPLRIQSHTTNDGHFDEIQFAGNANLLRVIEQSTDMSARNSVTDAKPPTVSVSRDVVNHVSNNSRHVGRQLFKTTVMEKPEEDRDFDHRGKSSGAIFNENEKRKPLQANVNVNAHQEMKSTFPPLTPTTPKSMQRQPSAASTRFRQSEPEEKIDLEMIRKELKPVDRRIRIDSRDKDFIDDFVRQTLEEVDENNTSLLSKLNLMRRNIITDRESADEAHDAATNSRVQLQQLLQQLNVTESSAVGAGNALKSPMKKQLETTTTSHQVEPRSPGKPKLDSTATALQTGFTPRTTTENDRFTAQSVQEIWNDAAARAVANDVNNNKFSGLMSSDQLKRIEEWRTTAEWDPTEADDSIRELEDYLNQQDTQSDITSIASRRSSDVIKQNEDESSSSNSSNYSDDGDVPTPINSEDGDAKFDYFFGF